MKFDEFQDQLEEAERARRQRVADAFTLLEQNAELISVRIEVHDEDLGIEKSLTDAGRERLSNARLKYLLNFLDVRGKAYSRLVTDLESLKAVTIIMEDFAIATWWQLSGGVPIESIPPTSPFAEQHPTQFQRDTILKRARHWIIEGHRRLDEIRKSAGDKMGAKPTRKGYRQEVKAWMRSASIESQRAAAKRLGISLDVLKSIMSSRGKVRYGKEKLEAILKQIGQSGT